MNTNILAKTLVFFFAVSIASVVRAGFGVGAYPLSPTTVSMWIIGDQGTSSHSAEILVYFAGVPNWHSRHWETDAHGNVAAEDKSVYRLVSKDVTLSIAVSADRKTLWVQGREFHSADANVFMVRHADQGPKSEVVSAVGKFDLKESEAEPLALAFAQKHPYLRISN